MPCVILSSVPSVHLETHWRGASHSSLDFMLYPRVPPSPLALPRIVSPPEEAMADNTPQARSSGLWASQHPTCFLCEMTDSCTVSTAPLLSQHSADPRQTQPRPGINVHTACLLSREQNRIHPAASASKQARSPGPGRP